MNNYFRITGYYPKADVCFIMDSFGKFNELYDFSSYLIDKRRLKWLKQEPKDVSISATYLKLSPITHT